MSETSEILQALLDIKALLQELVNDRKRTEQRRIEAEQETLRGCGIYTPDKY